MDLRVGGEGGLERITCSIAIKRLRLFTQPGPVAGHFYRSMVPRKQQADCIRGPYTLLLGQAVTEHIFGLIAAGETDEQRLVVSGLAHLKSLESNAKPSGGKDARSLFSGPLRQSLKP